MVRPGLEEEGAGEERKAVEEDASFFGVRGLHGKDGGLAVSFFGLGKEGGGFLDHVLAVLDDINAVRISRSRS